MKTLTLTVLQFNTFVKNILAAEEFLSGISVFGEVTNFKVSGGNAYFDLKDENAMLSCVKFDASDLSIKNGDKITVFGKVNFYVKSGRLNFIVAKVQASGIGELYQKFLELKNKLENEGMFDEALKKPIPSHAQKIGVVTSETGAVIRDIINVTRAKNKFTDIIVYPSKVQGVDAENELVAGINYFNLRDDIDIIIVARGGGSLEDLAPFNTEKIVRAIYDSKKPIISAVGHETDFTLCDFAADLRVPTPSVAAEVAVFDYDSEVERVKTTAELIYAEMRNKFDKIKIDLSNISSSTIDKTRLKLTQAESNLKLKILEISEKVNEIFKLKNTMSGEIVSILSKLNPLEILKNGYATIERDGKRVSKTQDIKIGDNVLITLNDGKIKAQVLSKE
ncbi:MAG: exodeoxyribonuclease VII large subunit [Clostridia bacterium]|nr:exodeoxyribonuclease VII large subunit [Clostridia bacterium]